MITRDQAVEGIGRLRVTYKGLTGILTGCQYKMDLCAFSVDGDSRVTVTLPRECLEAC